MGNAYVNDAGGFFIETIFGFYLIVVILRFMFQLTGANFYNPISQFVAKLTNPPLGLLRRIFPDVGGIDLAIIALALIVALLKNFLIYSFVGHSISFPAALVLSVADILSLTITIIIYAIIISAILSWFAPRGHNPLISLLHNLTNPILAPARRIIPPLGGLDLSPIIIIFILILLTKIIVNPLYGMVSNLA